MNEKQIHADDPYNVGYLRDCDRPRKLSWANVWTIIEVVILITAILILAATTMHGEERAAVIKATDKADVYETTTSAYDPVFNYVYYRNVTIIIGPPMQPDGYPPPPEGLEIRAVDADINIQTVHAGLACVPSATPVYHEYTGAFFFVCVP